MSMIAADWAARNSDGAIVLFRGVRPEQYQVEPVGPGNAPAVAYRSIMGCHVVATLHRECFGQVRCGECRLVGIVES